MTLDDVKGKKAELCIMAYDTKTGECFAAVPEKVLADLVSEFQITEEQAFEWLEKQYLSEEGCIWCPTKHTEFWVEKVGR